MGESGLSSMGSSCHTPPALQTAVLHRATQQLAQREGLCRGCFAPLPGTLWRGDGSGRALTSQRQALSCLPLLTVSQRCAPLPVQPSCPIWHPGRQDSLWGSVGIGCSFREKPVSVDTALMPGKILGMFLGEPSIPEGGGREPRSVLGQVPSSACLQGWWAGD